MRAWSTKIIKLLDDDDFNGRNSPCSVVSFSLSLDNQLEGTHGDSEWIRTAHIKNAPVDDEDRRSPLFTGRMLRRNNFVDDDGDPRQGLSYECPSNVGRNPNASRLSIRERLEPPRASMNPPEFNIPPRLESPEIDIRHELKCSCIEQRMEGPGPLAIREREPVGIAAPLEPFVFHRDQRGQEEPPSHFPPRFMRDELMMPTTMTDSQEVSSRRPKGSCDFADLCTTPLATGVPPNLAERGHRGHCGRG